MPVTNPPFALFCITEVPRETLNHWLSENFEGEAGISDLFLVTDSVLENGPRDGPGYGFGTKFPLTKDFSLPFRGKSIEDCARALNQKSEEITVDRHFFVVADDKSLANGSLVLCKSGDESPHDTSPSMVRVRASTAVVNLSGLRPGIWEDLLLFWDKAQRKGRDCI